MTGQRGLGNALRIGLAFALSEGYAGVITIDGNGKDGVESIPSVIDSLDEGFDLVQASRFLSGGSHEHTPTDRLLAIKLLVCPLLKFGSGFKYTDPTNGFKGLSGRLLLDERIQPFRSVFSGFNLQFYLNYIAPKLDLRVREVPASRVYPCSGPTPTKISGFTTRLRVLRELVATVFGHYDVSETAVENRGLAP